LESGFTTRPSIETLKPFEKTLKELQTQGKLQGFTIEFLTFLKKQSKIPLLVPILNDFLKLVKDYSRDVEIEITTMKPLNPQMLNKVVERLELSYYIKMRKNSAENRISDIKPTVKTVIDPSILGGFRAKIGEMIFDTTLKSEYQQRDSKLAIFLSSVGSEKDLQTILKKVNSRPDFRVTKLETTINKLQSLLEQAKKENFPTKHKGVLEESLKYAQDKLKVVSERKPLPFLMNEVLTLHQETEKNKSPEIQKKLTKLIDEIGSRVRLEPVSEGFLFHTKVANWKYSLLELEPKDPKALSQVVDLFETKVRKVNFSLPQTEFPYAFHRLKNMDAKALTGVPLEAFSNLSLSQLSQLPTKQMREILSKDLGLKGEDLKKMNLEQEIPRMSTADVNLLLYNIREELKINIDAKKILIGLFTNAPVNPNDVGLSISELKAKGLVPQSANSSLDDQIKELVTKRQKIMSLIVDSSKVPPLLSVDM